MNEETRQVTEVHTTETTLPQTTEHPQKVYAKKKTIFRIYQIIWYILGVIETLLIFRFILKALGANQNSGFTNLIYALSNPLAIPFRGIFPTPVIEGSVFEWSTLIAGVVYLVLAYGLIYLFQLIKPTNPQEVEQNVNQ